MAEFENLTVKYRNQIRPILEMLKSKKAQLSSTEWENLVKRTAQSIVNSPDQYLSELPPKEETDQIIFELFEEFLREGRFKAPDYFFALSFL